MRQTVCSHATLFSHPLNALSHPLKAATALLLSLSLAVVMATTLTGQSATSLPTADEQSVAEQSLAPGVSYEALDVATPRGTARAHVVDVDLWHPKVTADLLYPGVVAERQAVSAMANARGAIAGVNGDFFNISVTQPGVEPTGAPVGPAIAAFEQLKAAVPTRQRFGPSLPPGTTVEDVIGVGLDRVGRLGRLTLQGELLTFYGRFPVRGLNQYAIAENGIGMFTARWGTISRKRAICGTDARREDPCSANVHEVTLRHGRVVAISAEPGGGSIGAQDVVLLGREGGADDLRQLRVGDLAVAYSFLVSSERMPFRFAVGGQPILRDGAPLQGLDNAVAAIRSAAGVSANGRRLFLVSLDRNAAGMTYAELATLLQSVGAAAGVNLDGGGSSTLVARDPGASEVTVKNLAPGDFERPVPNGIGIFVRP